MTQLFLKNKQIGDKIALILQEEACSMRICLCPLILLCILLVLNSARAQEKEDRALAVLEKYKKAVVTVQLVLRQRMSFDGAPNDEDETKVETNGTVIAPNGLTVLALSATDPMSMFESVVEGM